MKRLWDWLMIEPRGWKSVMLVVGVAVFNVVYSISMAYILRTAGMTFEERSNLHFPTDPFELTLFLLSASLLEEIFFRLPLVFFFRWLGPSRWILLPALLLSIVFGAIHGGMKYVLIQGVAGVFLSFVFLKAGVLKGKTVKPLLTSWTAHFLTNSIIFVLASFAQRLSSVMTP